MKKKRIKIKSIKEVILEVMDIAENCRILRTKSYYQKLKEKSKSEYSQLIERHIKRQSKRTKQNPGHERHTALCVKRRGIKACKLILTKIILSTYEYMGSTYSNMSVTTSLKRHTQKGKTQVLNLPLQVAPISPLLMLSLGLCKRPRSS